MIEKGQKLKDGDFFKGGAVEHFQEILNVEGKRTTNLPKFLAENNTPIYYADFNTEELKAYSEIIGDEESCLLGAMSSDTQLGQEYNFEDFLQLCKNTFGNGEEE